MCLGRHLSGCAGTNTRVERYAATIPSVEIAAFAGGRRVNQGALVRVGEERLRDLVPALVGRITAARLCGSTFSFVLLFELVVSGRVSEQVIDGGRCVVRRDVVDPQHGLG